MFITRVIPHSVRLSGIAVLILLSRCISAQTERCNDLATLITQHAVWDPADFILQKLVANRVVMIADAGHGNPLYYKAVISSLNRWVANQGPGVPKKVFLALEFDSVAANKLKGYFRSGNIMETVSPGYFWGDQFTTGTLEFYDDLRSLRTRIDVYNLTHSGEDQINFDIIGPEKVIDLSNWTTQKREEFFISERDEYSSAQLKDLLVSAPDARLLVYYGGAHLQRGTVQKDAGSGVKRMGHFLAHYLSESFGSRGGVYLCDQVDVFRSGWLDQSLARIGKTFAIDNSVFRGQPIAAESMIPRSDGAIYEFAPSRKSAHISRILSENIVDFILGHIDEFRDSTKEFYRGTVITFFYCLSTAAAAEWHQSCFRNTIAVDSTILAWKAWRKSAPLDIVNDVSSLSYFRRYVDRIRLASEQEASQEQWRLAQITGFREWFPDSSSPQIRADSTWKYIVKYRKPIVVENLIHLLWVASKPESVKALAILRNETGQSFATAKQWSTWWEGQESK